MLTSYTACMSTVAHSKQRSPWRASSVRVNPVLANTCTSATSSLRCRHESVVGWRGPSLVWSGASMCCSAHSRTHTVSHQVPFTIWSTQLTAEVGSDTVVGWPLDEIKRTCGTVVVIVCMWEHVGRWLRANLRIQPAGAAAAASGAPTHLRSTCPPRAAEEHLEDGFRRWQLHSDGGVIIIGLNGGTWTGNTQSCV